MRAAVLPALLLCACTTAVEPSNYEKAEPARPHAVIERPYYPGYGEAIGVQPVRWSARSVARDFDRLMFQTEWGDPVPVLLKWEKPVTVALATPELAAYRGFLDELLARIRAAAPQLDLTSSLASQGDITLRNAPRAEMDEIAADALCFFIPHDVSWDEYKALDARDAAGWDEITELDKVTIFIPSYAQPYEIRSCILEEVTQALGPSNDLGALDDSIFNDDNAHVWPTSFDFLILRVLYDDNLRNGFSNAQAVARARAALQAERLGRATRSRDPNGAKFDEAVLIAESESDLHLRAQAAQAAISLAKTRDAAPHRLGEAYKAAAYVAFDANDPIKVIDYLSKAELAHTSALAANSIHLARVRSQLAVYLINLEQDETGLALLKLAEPVFAANGADWQLAHALRSRAIALSHLGRWAEAGGTALEALDWARYVYGGDSRAAASWRQEFVDIGLIGA